MKKITNKVVELSVKSVVFANIVYFGTKIILDLINTTGGSTASQNFGFMLLFILPSLPSILAIIFVRSFGVKVKTKVASPRRGYRDAVETKANFIIAD